MSQKVWIKAREKNNEEGSILYALLFSLFGLLINATYIDVFEASKVAYNFWMIFGLFGGYVLLESKKVLKKKRT